MEISKQKGTILEKQRQSQQIVASQGPETNAMEDINIRHVQYHSRGRMDP